ncbi:hypothetical protein [Streptomyces sp. NPDC046805]|uniref:hypothetical protein n=1 Tax=Streptomyces sp. NPDC046805 TaxID=3155134 RepID=UPI0033E9E7CD
MNDALENLKRVIRQQIEEEAASLTGQVRALVAEYQAREDRRQAELDHLRDEDGEPIDGDYAKLDERRTDAALEADDDLSGLLRRLTELTA